MNYIYVLYIGFRQERRTSVHWPGFHESGTSGLVLIAKDEFAIEIEAPVILLRVWQDDPAYRPQRVLGNGSRREFVELYVQPVFGEGWTWFRVNVDSPESLLNLCPEIKSGDATSNARSRTVSSLDIEGVIMGTDESMKRTYFLLVNKVNEGIGKHYKRVGILVTQSDIASPGRHHDDFLEFAEVKKILLI